MMQTDEMFDVNLSIYITTTGIRRKGLEDRRSKQLRSIQEEEKGTDRKTVGKCERKGEL